jgi:aminomethyltransferase
VGLVVDWKHYDDLYNAAGLIPPKDETPLAWESMLYDGEGKRIGYATSLMYSPVLQRHIAMARVHPDQAAAGNTVHLELTINHEYQMVRADVARMPLFNPTRKTA